MKTNMIFMAMVVVFNGALALAMDTQGTMSTYGDFFKTTIARPSLQKISSPSAATNPKTALVNLKSVKTRDLVIRVAILNNLPVGDGSGTLHIREQTGVVEGITHTKAINGLTLFPEEKELISRTLNY